MYSCVYCILYVFAESILRTTSCWRPPNSKKELQHGCIRKWKIDVIDRDRPLKLLPHFYRESMGTSQNPGSLLFTLYGYPHPYPQAHGPL